MMIYNTLEKLRELKLKGMSKGLEEQMAMPESHSLSFDDRFGLLVDLEDIARKNVRLASRLKQAKLREDACIENIDFTVNRGIEKSIILGFTSGEWIRQYQNIIISGPTGVGKTYLACAILHSACREGFTGKYLRTPRLLDEINIAKANGSYSKMLASYAKYDLLLFDDWGLAPMTADESRNILEIVEDRYDRKSSIITSQLPPEKWFDLMPDPTIADAILDRVIHRSHKMKLKGPSMRKMKAENVIVNREK
jgi:DNA replication protein DnaC